MTRKTRNVERGTRSKASSAETWDCADSINCGAKPWDTRGSHRRRAGLLCQPRSTGLGIPVQQFRRLTFQQFSPARISPGGFTLVELVVVMSMLGLLMLLIAATLWGAVKIEQADARALDRVIAQNHLADQFREDVARAIDAPSDLNHRAASAACLILKWAEERYVVYSWQDERLMRGEIVGAEEVTRSLSVGGDDVSVVLDRSGLDQRVITMRLVQSRGPAASRRSHVAEISAALGGDLQ